MRCSDLSVAWAAARNVVLAASLATLAAAPAAAAGSTAASLIGVYDGGQMEIAAGLELKANGRFQYGLSYGALDEEATGKWQASGDRVLLTSDPVTPPRYTVVSQQAGPASVLRIIIDFKDPYDQQQFSALITKSDGAVEDVQLGIDGLSWPFAADAAPTSVRLLLDVFQIVSEPLPLAASSGFLIHYNFEPNDFGKVAFNATPLAVINGELVLERHGRTLKFHRAKR